MTATLERMRRRTMTATPAAPVGPGPKAGGGVVRRMAHVDGLRALAAIWVTAFHAQIGILPHWDSGPLAFVIGAGSLGVPIFLVLSGFCLAYPVYAKGHDRVDLRSFAVRRALRILPPYYIVLLALAAAQALPGVAERTVREVTDLPDLIMHVLMIHNLFPDHIMRISGPFWSIALEVQLYLLFPLLLVAMRRPWIPLAGSLAVAAAWWLAAGAVVEPISADAQLTLGAGDAVFTWWNSLPSLLPLFVMGMIAARIMARPPAMPGWVAPAAVAAFVASILTHNLYAFPVGPKLFAGVATALILLLPAGRLARLLSWKPLVRIGEASFTLYLIHQPIGKFGKAVLDGRVGGPALVLGTLAVVVGTVAVSLVVSRVIERPFHRLARRLS